MIIKISSNEHENNSVQIVHWVQKFQSNNKNSSNEHTLR